MLETFLKEHGIYYVITALCALGVIGKCYESRVYARLLAAVDNPERTDHPFMKQLKLKYRNYYKLERRIHNTDAFIETHLYRYKLSFFGLESLRSMNNRVILLCIMTSCLGIAGCLYCGLEASMIMYHIVAGAMAAAGLELVEQQFGNDSKKRMLFVALKDYLENGLANQIAGRIRAEEVEESDGEVEQKGAIVAKRDGIVAKNGVKGQKNGTKCNSSGDLDQLSDGQVAVTKNIAEKVAAQLAEDEVVAQVIKEFFP